MNPAQNQLIDDLPPRERQRLLARCETVTLTLSEVLCVAQAPTLQVYFPTQGFISLVTRVDHHPALEVAMVGREGMVGAHLVLGIAISPLGALVQGAGACLRLDVAGFLAVLAACPVLARQLDRYLYVLMAQAAASAGCLHYHLIGPRLARWLLMSHDRAGSDRFHVTHEFLACMLGVRRVGVTVAAGALQRRGLISYHRGDLTVLDRTGLEAASCSCYATDRGLYRTHLTDPRPGVTP